MRLGSSERGGKAHHDSTSSTSPTAPTAPFVLHLSQFQVEDPGVGQSALSRTRRTPRPGKERDDGNRERNRERSRGRNNRHYSVQCSVHPRGGAARRDGDGGDGGDGSIDKITSEPHSFSTIPALLDDAGCAVMDEWFTVSEGLPHTHALRISVGRHDHGYARSPTSIATVDVASSALVPGDGGTVRRIALQALVRSPPTGSGVPSGDVVVPDSDRTADRADPGADADDDTDAAAVRPVVVGSSTDSSTVAESSAALGPGSGTPRDLASSPASPVSMTVSVWVGVPPGKAVGLVVKQVFIVRHAESEWNRAMRRHDPTALLGTDHPLSPTGMYNDLAIVLGRLSRILRPR